MIELQDLWNQVISNREQIDKSLVQLAKLKTECSSFKQTVTLDEEKLLTLKASIKALEIDLLDADQRRKTLESRKYTLTSERELDALTREIDAVSARIGQLEESMITLIDESDTHEKQTIRQHKELIEKESLLSKTEIEIADKIKTWKDAEALALTKYNALFQNLDSRLQQRFSKLIGAKPFKAVAAINNGTCSACNFSIPSSLVIESQKDETQSICTNCGRFIYSV